MSRKFIFGTLCAAAILGLSACGETTTDRALSGGAIGAGAGAVGGALLGHPVAGAAIGGAAGAATGGMTDKDDVNLGKPVWR
jgi:osmotically inducible lipoprotein OsmB